MEYLDVEDAHMAAAGMRLPRSSRICYRAQRDDSEPYKSCETARQKVRIVLSVQCCVISCIIFESVSISSTASTGVRPSLYIKCVKDVVIHDALEFFRQAAS